MVVLCLPVLVLVALAAPSASLAAELRPNAVVGVGVVGWHQYDQGQAKGVAVVNLSGPWHLGESWSFGGIGLALRTSGGLHRDPSEIGVAVPVATFRRGPWTTQAGVTFQSLENKNYAWVGTGFALPRLVSLFRRR